MREEEARIEKEYPVAGPEPDHFSDQMDSPMIRIMSLRARTIDGLAVKARVARYACKHFWDDSDADCDWDKLMARKLIDAVLKMAVRS